MKKWVSTIIIVVIFLCGLSLFLYPTVSNLYNEYLNDKLIGDYEEGFSDLQPEQYTQAKTDAQAYNQYRNDPKKLEELGLTYESVLNVAGNGIMGYIEIPKISVSLVIYHTVDDDLLQNGIGHVEETALPIGGESTHAVLAGHTGLPSAKLLTNIDHLDIGDVFYIHVLDEVLEYTVDDISVVEPDEVSRLNVISGKDCVTLVTCTPYGVNSHRLLVRGVRSNGTADSGSSGLRIQNDILNIELIYLVTFSLIGLFIIAFALHKVVSLHKKRKAKKLGKGGETANEAQNQ